MRFYLSYKLLHAISLQKTGAAGAEEEEASVMDRRKS